MAAAPIEGCFFYLSNQFDQLLMLRIHLEHVYNEFIDLELTVACATAVGEVLLSLLETARRWLQFERP